MQFLLVLAILAVVVYVVSAPLRAPRVEQGDRPEERPALPEDELVAELEAARETKYREIREAELDHRTGKLSDEDYQAVDVTLRTEAVEILRELDRAQAAAGQAATIAQR